MKQGEIKTAPIGTGVAILKEYSNGVEGRKSPNLKLMNPSYEYIEDGVHCITPAISFDVMNPKALYDFLHEYFNY